MGRRRGRRPAMAAVVAAGALVAGACGSSSADDEAVVDPTAETTVEDGGGPATTEPGGAGGEDDEIARVEEATTALVEYLGAYFQADHDLEAASSVLWANQYALVRFASGTPGDPQVPDYTVDITGITPVGEGWVLEGSLTATLADIEHTYTDVYLVEDEDGELAVADYCRTNPEGVGPLDGCLSSAVGSVAQKFTSDDGTVTVTVGPYAISMGTGTQSAYFTLIVDNQGTSPVRLVPGPLATSYMSLDLDSGTAPQTSADLMPVVAAGEKGNGVLRTNRFDADDDDPYPAGTLKFQMATEDGRTLTFGPYEVPGLPQDLEAQ